MSPLQKWVIAASTIMFVATTVLVALGLATKGDLVVIPGMMFAFLVDPNSLVKQLASALIATPTPTTTTNIVAIDASENTPSPVTTKEGRKS